MTIQEAANITLAKDKLGISAQSINKKLIQVEVIKLELETKRLLCKIV